MYNTQPIYNYDTETNGLFYSVHTQDRIVDVNSTKFTQQGRRTQPSYDYDGKTKGLQYSVYTEDGMVDVKF